MIGQSRRAFLKLLATVGIIAARIAGRFHDGFLDHVHDPGDDGPRIECHRRDRVHVIGKHAILPGAGKMACLEPANDQTCILFTFHGEVSNARRKLVERTLCPQRRKDVNQSWFEPVEEQGKRCLLGHKQLGRVFPWREGIDHEPLEPVERPGDSRFGIDHDDFLGGKLHVNAHAQALKNMIERRFHGIEDAKMDDVRAATFFSKR